MLGVILGTALLQVLVNAVQLLGIHSTWEMTVMGTVILIGVIINDPDIAFAECARLRWCRSR